MADRRQENPLDAAIRSEEAARAQAALAALPKTEQDIVPLWIGGYSCRQTASLLRNPTLTRACRTSAGLGKPIATRDSAAFIGRSRWSWPVSNSRNSTRQSKIDGALVVKAAIREFPVHAGMNRRVPQLRLWGGEMGSGLIF